MHCVLAAFPSLPHFPAPTRASWGHLPNKLLALTSLSQVLLLGGIQPKTGHLLKKEGLGVGQA